MTDTAARNRDIGEAVEQAVISEVGLVETERQAFDALTRDGRPVEIKATRRTYVNGRTGRFRVREDQHNRLCRHNGTYIFVLYSGMPPITIERTLSMSASRADKVLPLRPWADNGRADVGREKQLRWDAVEGL